MALAELDFHTPTTLSEAVRLLQAGDGAVLLAGGMSLVPTINLGLTSPRRIVSLNHVEGLRAIRADATKVCIGAMARHADVAADPSTVRGCPLLSAAASLIGDPQVRNRGTIGGSLSHADPAANYLCATVAAEARFRLVGAAGERWVPARAFFVDLMTTSIAPGEILTEIEVPRRDAWGSAYMQLSRVEGAYPVVNAAALTGAGVARLAVGGISAVPVVVELPVPADGAGRDRLCGDVEEAVEAAVRNVDVFEDMNASGEYRRALARVYARRAFARALSDARRLGGRGE